MDKGISRRAMIAGSVAAGALTNCSRRGPAPRVSIVRASGYGDSLVDKLSRVAAVHKLDVAGKRIVLKPNLVEFDPGTSINTSPALVLAAYEVFRRMGAAEVRIAEGPGHRRPTLDLADAAGYFNAFPRFEQLFTDLNLDDVSKVDLVRRVSKLKDLYLPQTVLRCDLLVSMPKMKTHHWVGATLSMKNFFGLVPGGVYGWPKNVLHWAGIHECIAELHALFPRTFAIVDGIEGMEGNGPIQGTPKFAGVIVAGRDLPAVDATCCRIMGIDPEKIRYLQLAGDRAQAVESNVKQIGESIASVRTVFEMVPEFASLRLPRA
jgi:uncharacterized protein (DUF362 family)